MISLYLLAVAILYVVVGILIAWRQGNGNRD